MIPVLLGYIAGLVTAVIIALLLAYFKSPLQRVLKVAEEKIASAGPRPKGYIFEGDDEVIEARKEIIAKNSEQGKSTPLSELP
jgi:hypothetical protein